MYHKKRKTLVLSIYPTSRGFAFALFEGRESPVDWGLKDVKGRKKNPATLDAIGALLGQYQPDVIVIENTEERGSRRSARIRRLYASIVHRSARRSIDVKRYSRRQLRQYFIEDRARTKFEIAQVIAARMPAFAHRLPPLRKIWMSEDARQGLFDALALALVHYACEGDGLDRLTAKV